MLMALGFLNPGSFSRSRPSAGNRQSVHIVNFPVGRTRSRHSAAPISGQYTCNSGTGILNFEWGGGQAGDKTLMGRGQN